MDKVVTIGIATFNSEEFIIETLESVKSQTYPYIELVLSDDCSSDSTISKVQDWLAIKNNNDRFVRIELLTVLKNTGVSANCNRIFNASKGRYVKLLAGDDILLTDCIIDNLNYFESVPQAKVVFSQVGVFTGKFVEGQYDEIKPNGVPLNLMHPQFDSKKQFEILLISDRITYTPSVFFDRETILSVGGFDESIRMIEDYPMWLKLTRAGIKLHYFNKLTVAYRRHGNALNIINAKVLISKSYITTYEIRKKYVHPHISRMEILSDGLTFFWSNWFVKLDLNHIKYKRLFLLAVYWFNPFWFTIKIINKLKQVLCNK